MSRVTFTRDADGTLLVHLTELKDRGRREAQKALGTYERDVTLRAPLEPVEFTAQDQAIAAKRKPNRRRISMVLDMCDLYGPEVDEALGVEEPTVDQWEDGTLVPSPEDIGRLARLTGYLPRWFYGESRSGTLAGFMCRRGRGGSCTPIVNDDDYGETMRLEPM